MGQAMGPECCGHKPPKQYDSAEMQQHPANAEQDQLLADGPKKSEGAPACCKVCCGIVIALLFFLLWFAVRIWTAECAVESFDVDYALPANAKAAGVPEPFDRGTTDNMDIDASLNIDLGGVWWMDGNPLPDEQLVSFAGADEEGSTFPTSVHVPTNLQRRWSWSDTFKARAIIMYYSMTAPPEETHDFKFKNSSYADIVPVADVISGEFGFKKMNADEWDRVDTYVLRRVIKVDGAKGPYWQKFRDWYQENYPSGRVIVYSSDNGCLRKCQYFFFCWFCNIVC